MAKATKATLKKDLVDILFTMTSRGGRADVKGAASFLAGRLKDRGVKRLALEDGSEIDHAQTLKLGDAVSEIIVKAAIDKGHAVQVNDMAAIAAKVSVGLAGKGWAL